MLSMGNCVYGDAVKHGIWLIAAKTFFSMTKVLCFISIPVSFTEKKIAN